MKLNQRGKFITFEGIDGAGKSSHIAALSEFIRAQGLTVICTREPGGTPLGEKLRALLLHDAMHLETETLLMFAARREHIASVIEPALARGDWVLCDRFSDATYAYQGGGRGLNQHKFAQLEAWVHQHLQPDHTFLFDLSPPIASARISAEGRKLDRFEQERLDFHSKVRQAYLERATQNPQRIRVINADQAPAQIRQLLETAILSFCV